jgi:hypothetical protein
MEHQHETLGCCAHFHHVKQHLGVAFGTYVGEAAKGFRVAEFGRKPRYKNSEETGAVAHECEIRAELVGAFNYSMTIRESMLWDRITPARPGATL